MTADLHHCPVWLGPVPCALRRLHNGTHLPTIFPRPLTTWDEPGLAASIKRHPAGRAR